MEFEKKVLKRWDQPELPIDFKKYEKAKKIRDQIENHEKLFIPQGIPNLKALAFARRNKKEIEQEKLRIRKSKEVKLQPLERQESSQMID